MAQARPQHAGAIQGQTGRAPDQPARTGRQLGGHKDRYKIKLRSAGYRLVYEVRDRELIVVVVAVGKRERNAVYTAAAKRQALGDG